jgi:polysaccharide export outer membrane protein
VTTDRIGYFQVLALGLFIQLGACSTARPQQAPSAHAEIGELPSESDGSPYTRDYEADSNAAALDQLWHSRMAEASTDKTSPEFVLGPGDVVRISIPQIPQLTNRLERVSEKNTITLPLLGDFNVSGMTEQDLLHTLSQRAMRFVYHPQVDVFIQHTENREVAVIGSVKTPGRYTLATKSDTLLTLIGRAGGMSDTASSRIILVPALSPADSKVSAASIGSPEPDHNRSTIPGRPTSQSTVPVDPSALQLHKDTNADPLTTRILRQRVVISTTRADDERFLELPARPGDVIIVPAAGEVTVQGWVDKPGAFAITPGMTVLGSIAAAGGTLFSHSATLLREQSDGRKADLSLDLAKLKSGEAPDIQVQSGDVLVVERSISGMVPYTLYFLVQRLGLGIPVTPYY